MSSCLEKLTIVLSLNASLEEPSAIGNEVFQIPATNLSSSSFEIWQKIASNWPELKSESHFTRTDGTKISASELCERLNAGLNWPGPLEFANLRFHVAVLPAMQQTIITIEEKMAGAKGTWDGWIDPVVSEPNFVQAWVIDADYDFWQNATDPIEYQVAGRSYSHLPMKSNGLPFPLEIEIIDTSKNPARVEIKQGYMEAIGHTIWISDRLLQKLGNHIKISQISDTNFSALKFARHITKICCLLPFNDEIDSYHTQMKIRSLLFY